MSIQELDKVQAHILKYDTYEQQGMYGTTSLEKPRYKAWVEQNNPGVDCTPLINRIDSKIGTGFHTIAEEAMNNTDIKCDTEKKMKGMIGDYEVGGTCDLVLYDDDGVAQVADFKTMKAYPAKKAVNGEEHGKFIKQLSIYAYLLRQQGLKVAETGIIYVFVVGWTMRDKAIPRTFKIELELLDDAEVEAYVKERIELLGDGKKEPEFDCPTWMCGGYCGVAEVCPHNNNHEFKA